MTCESAHAILLELTAGTVYFVRVKANGTGNDTDSEWSATESFTTMEEEALEQIETPKITALVSTGSSMASVSFDGVDGADRYVIQISTSSDFASASEWTVRRPGSYSIGGLTSDTTYYFRIKAVSDRDAQCSEWSEPCSVTLPASRFQDVWGGNQRRRSFFGGR